MLYQANHLGQFAWCKTDIARYRDGVQPNFHEGSLGSWL
jgi:hypothetical protein